MNISEELTPSPLLDRRELLRAGALGAATLGIVGLSPLAAALQVPTTAKNEKEYRSRLMALGGLSLMSAQLGVQKATNPDLKTFAGFEVAEQTAIAKALMDMKTAPAAMDARATEIVRQHQTNDGAAFDRVFAQAQLDVHRMLRELNESFLNSPKGNGGDERHARHIATIALPTIIEHIAHATALVAAVGP